MNQDTNTHGSEQDNLHYLRMLAKQYPTVQAASTEIINLQAILNLPKGTEHFISDLHGEYEAFLHILNSCSGVIKEKVDDLYAATISKADRDELCTLIYYPEDKLEQLHETYEDMDEWYRITLHRLIEICRWVSSKYTRSKVRKALPRDYAYIIDELLHTHYEETDKRDYYENIISTIIDLGQADRFIEAVSAVIKRMAVDHMHIVGDIFDRGPRADVIMDSLLDYHSVDIQWGNHDILWMGAASGSRTLVATVLANSIHYNNLEVIETGYGISLRPLSVFANEVYRDCDVHRFAVKLTGPDADQYSEKDKLLSARMHKAITIILFKLEGQKLLHLFLVGALQAAGNAGRVTPPSGRQRPAVQAAAGNLRLAEGSIRLKEDLIGTALAAELAAVGVAVPENIISAADLFHAAMVVAHIVLGLLIALPPQIAIGDQHPFISEWALRSAGHGVAQLMALEAGINEVIPRPKMPDAGGLKERVLRKTGALGRFRAVGHTHRLRDNGLHILCQPYHHGPRDLFRHSRVMLGGRTAGIEINARILHQNSRIEPDKILGNRTIGAGNLAPVFIPARRLVTDRHRHNPRQIHGIVQIVPPIGAACHVRRKNQMGFARPGG